MGRRSFNRSNSEPVSLVRRLWINPQTVLSVPSFACLWTQCPRAFSHHRHRCAEGSSSHTRVLHGCSPGWLCQDGLCRSRHSSDCPDTENRLAPRPPPLALGSHSCCQPPRVWCADPSPFSRRSWQAMVGSLALQSPRQQQSTRCPQLSPSRTQGMATCCSEAEYEWWVSEQLSHGGGKVAL